MEGAEWLARTLRQSEVSYLFFVNAVLRALAEALRAPIVTSPSARGFGVEGIRVEHPDQIAPALAADHSVVVDVATDITARAPEPWTPEE
jgi:thiamine pyrophosphate-dependent acetolactate synthase large subunit-like protein